MPNADSIRKAAEKRAQRKAARDGNADTQKAETETLAKLTQLQKAAKKDPEAAAEKQADADARVKATVDEDKMSLAYWRARGEEPPLFVLNYHASKGDAAIRDEARDLARAVGQVAYEQALDRDHRNRHSRERKMNRAVSEQARIKAAQTDDNA